jgi:hypothetical protein
MASSLDELDVKVYVDYPQNRRNVKAPFVYAVDGTSFDTSTAVNCYVEPVTRTAMGMPVPMTPEWRTTFTGQGYTRFQLADFTFTSPTSWKNIDFYATGDTYIYCLSNSTPVMNAAVKLTGGVKRNQPLFFSFIKQQKKTSNTNITAKLFWAGTNYASNDVQLHFKDDGSCDVYRGYTLLQGTIIATTSSTTVTGTGTSFNTDFVAGDSLYTIYGQFIGIVASTPTTATSLTLLLNATMNYGGTYHKKTPQKVASYSRNENTYNQQAVKINNNNPNNDYNDVYIMPMRGKELVVNTSFGLNFSHTFSDLVSPNEPSPNNGYYGGVFYLSESTPSQLFMLPEILPTGDFSVVIPNGKAAFQLAKIFFLSNWSIKSNTIYNEVSAQGFKNMGYRQAFAYTGTISCRTNSNVIKGFLTSFNSTFLNGRLFAVKDDGLITTIELGTVSSVISTTLLTLSSVSTGLASTGKYLLLPKKTGTITSTTSSNVITGVGTLFLSEVSLNDDVYDANNNYLGKVQSISTNTSMALYYNSMTDVSSGAYWLNVPMVADITTNVQAELAGPATSTQYSDIINPSLQTLFNGNTTDSASNGTYAILNLKQSSTSDPTNLLKNNDTTNLFYSGDITITWKPQKTKTTQVDITSIVESLSIERKETGEMGCIFSARKQNLIDLGISNPDIISNRSIKITLKPRDTSYTERIIFDGYLRNPEIEYIQGTNYDKYSLLTFEGYCQKQSLNDVYFTKAPSYDSLSYNDAIRSLLFYGGILGDDYAIDTAGYITGYSLGINRNNSNGQYNWTANVSDSIGSFIEKIRSELSQNVVYYNQKQWYFDPVQNKYIQSDVHRFSDSSNKAEYIIFSYPIYLSETSANTFGSVPVNKAYKRTIRNLKKTYEAPEANQVIVIGLDKTNNDRITSIVDDVNSQNPSITNRPNNWLGCVKSATIINDRLNSKNQVSKTANLLFNKISTGREIIEFQSDLLTFFDGASKATSSISPLSRTGVITTSTSSNTVTGVGTSFTTELVPGSKLYTSTGIFIGTVNTITSNTSLTLVLFAAVSLTNEYFEILLSGTIDTFTYSNVVNGVGTAFNTQLAPGNFLYSPNGYLIGTIQSITSATSLTLTSNALYSVSSSLYYTQNPYVWLYQYDYLDIHNPVQMINLDGTTDGYYKILSWKADFIKNNIPVYVSGIVQKPDQINIVQCTYKALKVTNENKIYINEYDFVNNYFENTINVLKNTASEIMLVVQSPGTTTYSLIANPSGMTSYITDLGNGYKAIVIQWTPTPAQALSVYSVWVDITNSTLTSNTYTIPLTFKVYDTL